MKQTAFQLSLLLPTLFQLLPTSLAYKWPDPQIDEADHYLYDQFGYKGNDIFGVGVPTCSEFFGAPNVGRQTAAEVRTHVYQRQKADFNDRNVLLPLVAQNGKF
jgi:hypothetical protein